MGLLGNVWASIADFFGIAFWARLFGALLVRSVGTIAFFPLVIGARPVKDALAKRRQSNTESRQPPSSNKPLVEG